MDYILYFCHYDICCVLFAHSKIGGDKTLMGGNFSIIHHLRYVSWGAIIPEFVKVFTSTKSGHVKEVCDLF